jgi:hypothetical protein
MLKTKQQLTVLILGVFLFAGAILPVTAFAQDYEDSPFGIATAGFIFNVEEVNAIDRIGNIGAGWVRGKSRFGRLIWDDLEPEKGVYDWTTMDNFYNKAIGNELHILTHIITYNNWDQPDAVCEPCFDGGCMYPATLPNDMDAYKTLVEKAMQRYPEIKKWVIGQEIPAGDYRWDGTAEDYAELFAETYSTIKNIDPADEVILYNIGYAAMDDESYRAQFLKAVLNQLGNNKGIRDFSVAVDSYQHADDLNIIEILNYVRSIISGEGFTEEEIPIILTDVTQLVDKEDIVVPEALQAGNVVKIYTKALAYGIKYVSWAQLGDAYHKKNKEAAFFTKVIENEEVVAHKKLAYFTYKLMTEKLEGSDWDNIQTIQESDNVYIYKFMKNGEPVWVAWWDYFDDSGTSKTITLDVGDMDAVKITEAVPDAEDGSKIDENDYPNFFKTEAKTTSGGRVEITLGESPVFVEEIKGGEPEEKTCSELNGTICSSSQTCSGSWLNASDSGWCCGGVCEATVIDYEDSPFGFIQGEVVYGQRPDATFLIDLGVHWNKVAAKNGIRFPSKNINDINFDTEVDFTELDKYVKEIFVDNGIYMSIPLLTFVKINNEKILLTHDQYRELNTVLIERYNGDGVDDMEGSPKVKYWFVAGSEMNTGIGKGQDINKRKWKLSEADTAEYVKIGYDLIKSFDSEFKVLLGGSNSICTWQKDTPCIWREEPEPDEFYYNLVSEMTGNLFCPDMIFDYHYGSNPTQFKSQIEAMDIVKETLSEFGYANNDIWTTDVGGSWDGLGGFTEIEQSGDVVRRYTYTIAHGQEKLFWTRIEEYHWTPDDSSIFDHMGLINNPANADGKYWKKLSYYTYKLMVDKLEGSDWDNIKTIQESDNVYIYKFMKNGDSVWVAWWDYFDDSGSSKIITIDVGDINSVKITEAVPKYETGQEVTDYSTAFNLETKIVSGGKVEIILEESPVFVEAN